MKNDAINIHVQVFAFLIILEYIYRCGIVGSHGDSVIETQDSRMRICISNPFPGDAEVEGPGTTFQKPLLYSNWTPISSLKYLNR